MRSGGLSSMQHVGGMGYRLPECMLACLPTHSAAQQAHLSWLPSEPVMLRLQRVSRGVS